MTHHTRRHGLDLEQRIWGLLRAEPKSVRAIAEAMRVTRMSVTQALRRLEAKGCAVGLGNTHQRKWHAVGRWPIDMRGFAPRSVEALERFRTWESRHRAALIRWHGSAALQEADD